MNKQILKTKLKSIEHYVERKQELKEAIMQIESVLSDLLKDLTEFIPFEEGDLIVEGESNNVLRFIKICDGCLTTNGIPFVGLSCNSLTNRRHEFHNYFLAEAENWTIVKRSKKEEKK